MKTRMRNATIYHFARWIFAMFLLTPLLRGAPDGRIPDLKVETSVNQGISVPRFPPSYGLLTLTAIPVSPERFGPFHGTLSGFGDRTRLYTPFPNFAGTDQFKYEGSTEDGTNLEGMVIITVKNAVSINDISIFETTAGTRIATFTARLEAPPGEFNTVSVSFRTAPGTAQEGSDYIGTSGTLTFSPGVQSQTIFVPVIGDLLVEPNETFFVQLLHPSATTVIKDPSAVGTIVDFAGSRTPVGTAEFKPADSLVQPGEPVVLSLSWTHPVGWRQLESIDLLIVDDEDAIMAVRWHEADNSFSLYKPATDRFVRTARAGSPAHFETSAATMLLEESTGGGPPGKTVTIQYGLAFKPQAGGRTFRVETFATDDAGNLQGFEQVGTLTVLPH